ncbi:MAG: hypothetical protein E6H06_12685 [Bacteroidetes bacterium]|nr:MAG: hypothetical protein E6H06_12685 [Bacteroidota bacterium]
MKGPLYYLVQVVVCSAILYGYYHFALRNRKFHQYNRYYLLLTFFISIVIPFFNIPVYFSAHEQSSLILQTLTVFSPNSDRQPIQATFHTVTHPPVFHLETILRLFYSLIACVVFIRFLYAMVYIKRLLVKYDVEKFDQIYFINTEDPRTPFSFFKWLFWNKEIDLKSERGEQIFRHELFHIQQKHSWDIVIVEILTSILWINPSFYYIKKEIKAIHEFLADEFATEEKDKWKYAELLLMTVLGSSRNHLVNPFFHNHIKRRIAMITSFQKTSYQYLRKIMVLPVAAVVIALFAFTYKTKNNREKIQLNYKTEEGKTADTTRPKEAIQLNNVKIWVNGHDKSKKTDSVLVTRALIVIDGKEQPNVKTKDLDIKINPNEIESIIVLKGPSAIAKYGEKGRNGVIEILTKSEVRDITIEKNLNVNANEDINVKTDIKVKDTTPQVNNQIKVDNIIFEKVEVDPSFPGGEGAWRNFLLKNLKGSVPAEKGAPAGAYTVWLQFIVDKEGNISDTRPLTNHGYGMEEECVRIMKLSPRWIPATQNGHIVTAYRKQPITFVVGGDKNDPATFSEYPVPPNGDYNDPVFRKKWRDMISEIKAIAWKEGKAAYEYRGRTYVFGQIKNPDPTVAAFTEQNGTGHVFELDGELIKSVDELNRLIKRKDVKKFGFIDQEAALKRFKVNEPIVFIETGENDITKKD